MKGRMGIFPAVTLAAVAGGVLFYWKLTEAPLSAKVVAGDGPGPVVVTSISEGNGAEQEAGSESLESLISHPNVQRYLERESRKEQLQKAFHDVEAGADIGEAWRLIEDIEKDGGVLAYEGLAMKLALLERSSTDRAAFERQAAALTEEYRQRAQVSVQEYSAEESVPGFREYKAAEQKIVAEVQQMDRFPDGLSRQEYLRQRLQQAREQAYGN